MSNEIRVLGPTGAPMYVHLINQAGLRWNGSIVEAFSVGHYSTYTVAVAEDGASGVFLGDAPALLPAGTWDVVGYVRAGGSPANGDRAEALGSLVWGGTATSPTEIPLGSLTGAQMLAYIVRGGLIRDDMETELYDALTDTVLELEQAGDFDERDEEKVTTDTISTLGDNALDLEADFGKPITLRLLDNNYSRRLVKISKAAYDEMWPNTNSVFRGRPEFYAIFKGQLLIGPPPDRTSYRYEVAYSKRLTSTIDPTTNPVPFSQNYREVLKDGTLARLFRNLGNSQRAADFQGPYADGFKRIQSLEHRKCGGVAAVRYNDC